MTHLHMQVRCARRIRLKLAKNHFPFPLIFLFPPSPPLHHPPPYPPPRTTVSFLSLSLPAHLEVIEVSHAHFIVAHVHALIIKPCFSRK